VDGSGGKGLVVGPAASKTELDELRARLIADPRGWIAQPVVQLSTIPTLVDDGMRPRHADLRPFAVNDGKDIWVLPGGLTRVALPEGELVVNSSQGGGSKDTWVVGLDPLQVTRHDIQGLVADQAARTESIGIITPEMLKEHARDHAPLDAPKGNGQQEQQQQQRLVTLESCTDAAGGLGIPGPGSAGIFGQARGAKPPSHSGGEAC
jgi:uncharacterized circularly permuted ATP-grasp superfamily protein